MRDDFPRKIKELLARRVGYKCSNPHCRQTTSGPQIDPHKTVNIGVAAHITAASPKGARYDANLSPDKRRSAQNGIWLCQKCAKLIDNDSICYDIRKITEWKRIAETSAEEEIERGQYSRVGPAQTTRSNEVHFKEHFPRISRPVLENFVKRITHKYTGLSIERITLYRYHSKYFSGVNTKYAVVIEVNPNIKNDDQLSQLFHDLQYATGWMGTVPDPDSSKELGIDRGFSDVYIDKPEKDYLKEWAFYAKYTDDPMPIGIMADEETFILFKSNR